MSTTMERLEANPEIKPQYRNIYILGAIAGVLAIILYSPAYKWWIIEWTTPGSYYAHGVFVPFFIAAMIYKKRDAIRKTPVETSWWGLTLIIPAMLMVLFSARVHVVTTLSLSLILFVYGTTWLVAGKRMTRILFVPLLFLFTMIPLLPEPILNPMAFPIQFESTKLATSFLNLLALHAVRSGTSIQMPDYRLAVELPCSGFKLLIAFFTIAGAFGYLLEAANWKRWVIFLVGVPLSLLTNSIRIALIGIVGETISAPAASTFHDYSGVIVLVLAFSFLLGLSRLLKCEKLLGIPLMDEPAPAGGTGSKRNGA